jgi:peptide/nickel transport system permease protein
MWGHEGHGFVKKPILLFVGRRMLFGATTLLVVSLLIFLVTQALPADPASAILGREANPEALAAIRADLGLDRPWYVQYFDWLLGVLSGDFGTSYATRMPVADYLGPRVGYSFFLMGVAAITSIPLSIVIGSYAALKRDKKFDTTSSIGTLVLAAMPEFVVGTLLIILFATTIFQWLPAVTYLPPGTAPWQDLDGIVLPVATLVISVSPYVARVMRAAMVEVLESDYVEMARLKGMPERTVLWRHSLPNAIGPTLQVIALNLAFLAGGVIVVERLFNYPGIGSALADAVRSRDMPVVQFLALIIASVYVVTNLLADVGTVLVTPRLRTRLK